MHFKLPSFRKRPPLPNGSTAQQPVDDLEDRPSFFRTNRKMIALAVIAIALVVISGLFNRGSHSTPTDVATQQSQQEQLAAQNQMISTLHNQLEAERKRSQQTADAVLAMSSAPNPASLTPQQQAALYAASQGQTNPYAVQQAGYRGGRSNQSETQKTPDVPKAPNDTAEIITFAVPASKEPAAAAPEPGDGVKTAAGSNEEKPEDTEEDKKPDPRFTQATGPTYRIRRGTLLPCTQMLRINGAFASSHQLHRSDSLVLDGWNASVDPARYACARTHPESFEHPARASVCQLRSVHRARWLHHHRQGHRRHGPDRADRSSR